MESFFALLQKNVLDRRSWPTREQLRIAIVTWIERTYHRRRRQAALGRLTPVEPRSRRPDQARTAPRRSCGNGSSRCGTSSSWTGWMPAPTRSARCSPARLLDLPGDGLADPDRRRPGHPATAETSPVLLAPVRRGPPQRALAVRLHPRVPHHRASRWRSSAGSTTTPATCCTSAATAGSPAGSSPTPSPPPRRNTAIRRRRSPTTAWSTPPVYARGGRGRGDRRRRTRSRPCSPLHGITQKNGKPFKPTTQGKIERFWQTLKKHLDTQPAATLADLQTPWTRSGTTTTTSARTAACGRRTPAFAYQLIPKAAPTPPDDPGRLAGPLRHHRPRREDQPPPLTAACCTSASARAHARTEIICLIHNNDATIISDTGEVLAEFTLNPAHGYQRKNGRTPEPGVQPFTMS